MTEAENHRDLKHFWIEELTKQGYDCELEKSLQDITGEYMIADVYAENSDSIIIVEVINTSWSAKDPRDYLDTYKNVIFIVSPVDTASIRNIIKKRKAIIRTIDYERVIQDKQKIISVKEKEITGLKRELNESIPIDKITIEGFPLNKFKDEKYNFDKSEILFHVLFTYGRLSVDFENRIGNRISYRFKVKNKELNQVCAVSQFIYDKQDDEESFWKRVLWFLLQRFFHKLLGD